MTVSADARRAVIEWASGHRAELTLAGWRVDPPDPTLAALLNSRYGLAEAQRARGTALPRDLLAFAAHRAALGLGAELVELAPAEAAPRREPP